MRASRGASEGSPAHPTFGQCVCAGSRPPVSAAVPLVQSLYGVYILNRGAGPSNEVQSLRHRCVDLVLMLAVLLDVLDSCSDLQCIQPVLPGAPCASGNNRQGQALLVYQMITTLWVSFTVSVPSSLTTYDFPPPHPSPIRARQAHRPDSDAMGACGSSYCDVSSWFSCLPTVHGTSLLVWDGLQFS